MLLTVENDETIIKLTDFGFAKESNLENGLKTPWYVFKIQFRRSFVFVLFSLFYYIEAIRHTMLVSNRGKKPFFIVWFW